MDAEVKPPWMDVRRVLEKTLSEVAFGAMLKTTTAMLKQLASLKLTSNQQ